MSTTIFGNTPLDTRKISSEQRQVLLHTLTGARTRLTAQRRELTAQIREKAAELEKIDRQLGEIEQSENWLLG
jgi:hypothetical protein